MKKILATIVGLAVGASLVQAQGWLQLTSGVSWNANTNTGTFGNPTVPNASAGFSTLASGKSGTFSSGLSYDMAFLYIAAGGLASSADSNNLASSDWVQLAVDNGSVGPALMATNTTAGNFQGQNGANSTQAIGIGGQAFNNGTSYQVALVVWSTSLGSSWSTVLAEYENYQNTGSWGVSGFFGDVIGNNINPSAAAPGNTIGAMSGNGTMTLYSVPVPEPTTLALAGLGGISLLFLRRRKS